MNAKQALMTACHRGRGLIAWVTGRRGRPVHAMVITPAGRLVLVRHSYVPGWHFPGGALRRGEAPEAGILRELREEIGLLRWGAVSLIERRARPAGGAPMPLFVFTDAEYRFRPSLEIDRVAEFDLDEPMQESQRRVVDHWRGVQPAWGLSDPS